MYGVSECQTPCLTDVHPKNARPGWFSPKFKTYRTIHRTAQSNQNFMNFVSYFEYL